MKKWKAKLAAVPGEDNVRFESRLENGTIHLRSELVITDSVNVDASFTVLPGGITLDLSSADATPNVADGAGIRAFYMSEPTHSVRIEGFTITGGDVDGAGGAILATAEQIRVFDNVLVGNSARTAGALSATADRLFVNRSTISGNSTYYDSQRPMDFNNEIGGAHLTVDFGQETYLRLTDNVIVDNLVELGTPSNARAGGIMLSTHDGAMVELRDNLIAENRANLGGGARTSEIARPLEVVNSNRRFTI